MEDFATFDIAKKLKEKGFNEPCLDAINSFGCTYRNGWLEYLGEQGGEFIVQKDLKQGDCLLPTISQVLKWLRETKSIHLEICMLEGCWACPIIDLSKKDEDCDLFNFCVECLKGGYKSYEEAALAGVNYVLDNLI